jgi:hypothetical protein
MPDRRSPAPAKRSPSGTAEKPVPPKEWGLGRVAFFACIDTVRAEIGQGWPLTIIHARHRDKLGICYSAFCKLVGQHAADARPGASPRAGAARRTAGDMSDRVKGPGTTSHNGFVTESGSSVHFAPQLTREGERPHGGQQPSRTFVHDPVERPGDYERLLGCRKK